MLLGDGAFRTYEWKRRASTRPASCRNFVFLVSRSFVFAAAQRICVVELFNRWVSTVWAQVATRVLIGSAFLP